MFKNSDLYQLGLGLGHLDGFWIMTARNKVALYKSSIACTYKIELVSCGLHEKNIEFLELDVNI